MVSSLHITQVIIRGFKTYKDQVSLAEDFHPGVNVVVGFNGSGKSNFFNAILFVISDHFGTLRAEVRKSLLHEGSGPAVLTAFVELAFDNSSRRLPIDRDDVRIRRTIGVKKDDYTLDGKHATKTEIFNLLESCGFTKSNPYYIVQQGKVSELTLMNDRRRLELVKEISGAAVYDERKAESDKILEDVKTRREKTDEVIDVISQRIRNLEEEQRELVEYQQLERTRRCLDYELTDRDWRAAQDRLDALEAERVASSSRLHELQRDGGQLRGLIGDAEADVQHFEGRLQRLVAEREALEQSRHQRLEQLTRARLELEDEAKRAREGSTARSDLEGEAKRLRAERQAVRAELAAQLPLFQTETARRRELLEHRQVSEAQRDQLLAKQGRKTQYENLQQRDKALKEDIARRCERRDKTHKLLRDCEAEVSRAEAAGKAASETLEARRLETQRLENQLNEQMAPQLRQLEQQVEESTERRRRLLLERERLAKQKEEADRQRSACQNKIDGTMPRPQRNALNEVLRWVKANGYSESVYGTLLDNIEVPPTYCIAAESTAGNNLFNLLVKDDDIAGQIIQLVRKASLGSIVCTPLNQVQVRPRVYPSVEGAKPLVELVKSPDWCRKAVLQVFGRTMVCPSIEVCDEVSRKHGLDTITLDGDKVSSRGMLTGGYQDPSRFARIAFAAKAREARQQAEQLAPAFAKAEQAALEEGTALERLHQGRRKIQEHRGRLRGDLAAAVEAAQEQETIQTRQEDLARRTRERRDELQRQAAECDAAIRALQLEVKSTSLGDLTQEEQVRLQQLLSDLKGQQADLEGLEERCHQMERHIQSREQHLQEFLNRRLRELEASLMRSAQSDHEERLREHKQAVARLEREHAEVVAGLDATRKQAEELDATLGDKKNDHARLAAEDQQNQAKTAQVTAGMDEIQMKANQLVRKKSEADEKLRGLTVVSTDMIKYKGMDASQIMRELQKNHEGTCQVRAREQKGDRPVYGVHRAVERAQ